MGTAADRVTPGAVAGDEEVGRRQTGIPRIFHQVWVGGSPLPAEFEQYGESWRRHHPDWEFRLWTEDNLPGDLRRREVYDRSRVPAERSDMIRFDLLWRHGGVYMDTDFECVRPIDDLIEGVDFFTALLKPEGRVNNAVFGASARHPILDRGLEAMRPQELGAVFDKSASGSVFFERLLLGQPDVTVFPAEYFYPTTPAQRAVAYAIHHSARSWKDLEGWRLTAILAEERLEKEQRAHEKTRLALEQARQKILELKEKAKYAKAVSKSGSAEVMSGTELPLQ